MALRPPTSRLPPIQRIASHPVKDLAEALTYLRHIYNPEVRGSRRCTPEARSGNAAAPMQYKTREESGLDELRSDAFERSHAIRWLTALVAQAGIWDSQPTAVDSPQSASSRKRDQLIHDAASILAICSGAAAAGTVVRDFIFDRPGGGEPIKVHMKDVPLDNSDYGSVGAQTWGGACVLAEIILDEPARFGLLLPGQHELRILELGAGTGLVSLTVGKLLESSSAPYQGATIIATDYYPSVLENLESNIRSNFSSPRDSESVRISSHFLDWSFANEPSLNPPFDEPFDLVLGADIVYEAEHARWIKSCLTKLMRKPSGEQDPSFHLMIPLRSTHTPESSTVDTVFACPDDDTPEHRPALKIIAKETIICDAGTGLGPDQVEYAYYRIGWR
ncbi:putative lysine methyltransferase [Lyophyllum shimeji]|uniref:Lysine methyltransferase n=1 Tax=Lyophyllum shimeji TaxID=47721 RepID=A0A9P3PJZ5_LYOSH|nr:putative lysine methyltransferase [Lyophyllum shimeji]